MAITKTNFIEFTRCRRYPALESIRQDKLDSKLTIEEYKKEEENEEIKELLSGMFEMNEDGTDTDLTYKEDIQLNAMMKYYKEVEIEAARVAKKIFKGKFVYSEKTYNQESFDFVHNGIRYLCYTDIYNENDDEINIIEVKATTSRKYIDDMLYGKSGGEKYPLFKRDYDNIYKLNKPNTTDEKVIDSYNKKYNKLFDRYSSEGKYVLDIATQRYIIEHDLKEHNINKKVNYYLAVLNHNYVYDGYRVGNTRVYREINGEEIVNFFDMNEITEKYQPIINDMVKRLEDNIFNPDPSPCGVGKYCSYKKTNECKYKEICYKNVPKYNASFNYIGFSDSTGFTSDKLNKYDLINNGYLKLDDIPIEWIKDKPNMMIERDCYDNDKVYVDKEKIKAYLSTLKYPIYHLDFETLPCPMPRFRGEKPYTQSCFEFSLHIEREPGKCDNDKDNYVFLAETLDDERENLVKELVSRIDGENGTMLAQNVNFERSRIKELAEVFPEYRERLLKIRENSTDLLYVIRTNTELYKDLGFDEDRCKLVNFYHKNQSGSYSIKKTLPVLSDLTYANLEVKNGTEALVTYSQYDTMNEFDLNKAKKALKVYCKQDTWAMVVILEALRKICK
ncbi:MAG: DUF2779 domain-containing protein [Bacilli bacterium]|nr:DUF2779 domain-containing protein [Bacilli bacterium]